MSTITFTVACIPVAQPRPRATLAHGGKHARMHEVTTVKTALGRKAHPIVLFKVAVRQAGAAAYDGPLLDGPLSIEILALMPRPQSMIWKTRPMPRASHSKKPDWDNIGKAVCDALTGVIWRGDEQICDARVRKLIAAGDERPSVTVIVSALADDGSLDGKRRGELT